MKKKSFIKLPQKQRLIFIALLLVMAILAVWLILKALNQNIVFFLTPTMFHEEQPQAGQALRLGGVVMENSLRQDGTLNYFTIYDGEQQINVVFEGILPALFREGQGVIAEGVFEGALPFLAKNILAKHDENYIPRELVESLKNSGQWKGAGQGADKATDKTYE